MIADPPVRGKQKPGKQKTSAAAAERHEGAHVVEPLEIQRRLFEPEDPGARPGGAVGAPVAWGLARSSAACSSAGAWAPGKARPALSRNFSTPSNSARGCPG